MNMVIEKTKGNIQATKGREPKYPFKKLKEGETLKVDINDERDVQRIKSAFFQFRKYNNLPWRFRIQRIGNTIFVHRLKD